MIQILIAGVGGQGTLLTSKVLGALAVILGQDVKVSEVHGMAQRGFAMLVRCNMTARRISGDFP